jgi:hypothetical protein
MLLGIAAGALAGAWLAAGATPAEPVVVHRAARIPAPFVPSIDLHAVPGFTMKMRGERIVYCRTEQKLGTRFRTETCFDQAQMPAYLAALEENRALAKSFRTGENRIN